MGHYYDIDDILMEEELVSVVFQKAANGVGLLDPSAETNSVEQGSKVELAFWLAHELHLRQAVSVNVPACFDQKNELQEEAFFTYPRCTNNTHAMGLRIFDVEVSYQNVADWLGLGYNPSRTRKEIQADAACVDLRNRCPYFYELGCKIAPLVGDKTIGALLLYAFKSRYKDVLIKGHTAAFSVAPKFLTLLTKEETNLYEAAQSSMAAFKKWRIGGARFQRAAILGKKRRPDN